MLRQRVRFAKGRTIFNEFIIAVNEKHAHVTDRFNAVH